MSSELPVLERVEEGVALLTINRPGKLNALNAEVIDALIAAFERLRSNNAVRVVVLTGAGSKAFAAGADLNLFVSCDPRSAREISLRGQKLTTLVEGLGKPVIAAVRGWALGGGCELALACSFRIASEDAGFGQPEVKLGVICGFGGTQRLPRLVGKGRALELLLAGEPIDAREALRIGLVNRVVKPDDLLDEALSIAKKICAVSRTGVRFTLKAVHQGEDVPLAEGLDLEAGLFGQCFASGDAREGISAFLQKRPPQFPDR